MSGSLLTYAITAAALWVLGSAGIIIYSQQQSIPAQVWMAVLPALLLELTMYIAPGFVAVREKLAALGSKLAPILIASAVAPYLLMSVPLGTFRLTWLLALVVLAVVITYWYRVWTGGMASDVLFLALVAALFLSPFFKEVYVNPAGKPALDIVGRLMWIRVCVLAILLVRGVEGVDYGFVPSGKDWKVGTLHFLMAACLIGPIAASIGFVHLRDVTWDLKMVLGAAGTFLGMLWVVALSEEFFFRGLLQQALLKSSGSVVVALAATSVVFGAAHLPMRGFPNWKFALCATVAGVFYGLAFLRGKSIRSSMVTHALVNTAWRVFFTS
ncbi:MAG: CPBP family intramembrane metalloprotease [Candidatus Solibacter usitatus]|nr:CPBP family intramembrane metalloprotease [Candidatus Solibacter usitatus]